MLRKRNKFLQQHPSHLGKLGTHSPLSFFFSLMGVVLLIHPCSLPPWGRLSTGRVSLTFSVHPNSYFLLFQWSTRIPPQEFWTSTKALSSLGVCLSQNLTLAKRGTSVGSLTSSCTAMLRCICLLQMHRFARILSNPLAYVSRYPTCTEALLFMDEY